MIVQVYKTVNNIIVVALFLNLVLTSEVASSYPAPDASCAVLTERFCQVPGEVFPAHETNVSNKP